MPVPQANPRIRVRVVHEDDDLLVVNKMPGIVTEPGAGHRDDSLVNGLFAYDGGRLASRLARLGEARDYGLLHRLDRLTSGLVLVALANESYDALRAAFEGRRVNKTYLAILRGECPERGTIDEPLLERQDGHRSSAIDPRGQPAHTRFRVLVRSGRYALAECEPVTGRLHQVRVHLASIGAPVAGDPLYDVGGRARPQGRGAKDSELFLHAWKLGFAHPADGAYRAFVGEIPRRFLDFARAHELVMPNEKGAGTSPAP